MNDVIAWAMRRRASRRVLYPTVGFCSTDGATASKISDYWRLEYGPRDVSATHAEQLKASLTCVLA